jgi:hypothetical protein
METLQCARFLRSANLSIPDGNSRLPIGLFALFTPWQEDLLAHFLRCFEVKTPTFSIGSRFPSIPSEENITVSFYSESQHD